MNKNKWRKVTRMTLAFLCSLSVYFACVLVIIRVTLGNQLFMERVVASSNYVETVTAELNHTISDLGRGSNIPEDVLNKLVTENQVEENIAGYIQSMYSDSVFHVKGSSIVKQAVKENIENYAKDKNYPLNESVKKTIETLQISIVTAIQQAIEINSLHVYGGEMGSYKRIIDLLIVLSMTISYGLIAGIIALNSHFWHRMLRYLAYIFAGSGLMLLTFPLILYKNQMIERVGISSRTFYLFITTYINHFILMFIKWGGVVLFTSAICFLGSEYIRRKTIIRKN